MCRCLLLAELVLTSCCVQLKPEASSVPEDGRAYEMLVESTVPVPCPDGSPSPAERCTLSLQLRSSSEGDPDQL